jgi:hypothetical protein
MPFQFRYHRTANAIHSAAILDATEVTGDPRELAAILGVFLHTVAKRKGSGLAGALRQKLEVVERSLI